MSSGLSRRLISFIVTAALFAVLPQFHDATTALAASNQRLGVLASFYPSERDFPGSNHPMWDRLAAVGSDAGLVATVELTASSIDYIDFIAREKRVGQTTLATLNANVEHLMVDSAIFQKNTFAFDGVLLRGYTGACDGTQPSQALIGQLRNAGFTTIAIATTAQPASCFATLADVLLNYTGSQVRYGAVTIPSWRTGSTPKLWHVVYGVDQSQIASVVTSSISKGADYVMTSPDSGPIEATIIPADPYWATLRSSVREGATSPVVNDTWPLVSHQRSIIPAFGVFYPNWPLVHSLPLDPYGIVIVNADNGPGLAVNSTLLTQVQALKSSGRTVLGYVTAGFLPSSQRTIQQVVDEAVRFRSLYGVDGFFLDEVRPECTSVSSYATLASQIHSAAPGPIVLNPGRNAGECLIPYFDQIVNYEGPMSSYLTWHPSTWTGSYPASKFIQLIHTAQTSDVATAVQLSRLRQAGRVYVTTLPGPLQWTSPLAPSDVSSLTAEIFRSSARDPAPLTGPAPASGPRAAAPAVIGVPAQPRSAAPSAGG